MCRLFGFRSALESSLQHSLIDADNALLEQSTRHSDGWGVAYYLQNSPHLIKSTEAAFSDRIFQKVSGVLFSQTVVAHLRLATIGQKSILNSHPFQFGTWIFAHNGNIQNFQKYRAPLLERISENLRCFILGETDSEIIFFLMLTFLAENKVDNHNPDFENMQRAIFDALAFIEDVAGKFSLLDEGPEKTYLTFLLTNGRTMFAFQGGKKLYYSTYKQKCDSRETCPLYSFSCENQVENDRVRHLLVSSEPVHSANIWQELPPGTLIGVSEEMIFSKKKYPVKALQSLEK
ncbi:MAG: class II glutamine amidotransferase [Leptospiraceae bacterium]|nr:class II glutamine amidotransferase [Leptospiraceae bacterium]